jgi:succinate dehydrogenase / fumarate reductase cytochrome b subunit
LASVPDQPRNRVRPAARPLSPHLGIYKWGPHMLVSIIHRATGTGMALVGLPLFVWWLAAASGGEASYNRFLDCFTTDAGGLNILGWVLAVGLSLAFFQHMTSGIRHWFMDVGDLFELKANKTSAVLTIVVSLTLAAVFWIVRTGVLS